jgi:signal transduction histidine kinase
MQRGISKNMLQVEIDPAAAYVIADSTQFTRAVGNILQNAAEAGAKSVKVSVRPTEERGVLEIDIEDDGAGMNEETMRKAWSPFFTTRGVAHHGWVCLPRCMSFRNRRGALPSSVKKAREQLSPCSCPRDE